MVNINTKQNKQHLPILDLLDKKANKAGCRNSVYRLTVFGVFF